MISNTINTSISDIEKQLLRKSVTLLDDNIVQFDASLDMCDICLEIIIGRAREFFTHDKPFYLLIDISASAIPNVKKRAKLKAHLKHNFQYINHMSVITGKNRFINLMAKFIWEGVKHNSISIHTTRGQALNTILKKRNKIIKVPL